jgi:hypothetical protein
MVQGVEAGMQDGKRDEMNKRTPKKTGPRALPVSGEKAGVQGDLIRWYVRWLMALTSRDGGKSGSPPPWAPRSTGSAGGEETQKAF